MPRLGAVLEDDHLLATILAQHLTGDERIGHDWRADLRVVAVGDEQDALEAHRLAGRSVKPLDRKLAAELDSVLLSAGFDDCVHGSPMALRSGSGARACR